jgi:hypothetical protein
MSHYKFLHSLLKALLEIGNKIGLEKLFSWFSAAVTLTLYFHTCALAVRLSTDLMRFDRFWDSLNTKQLAWHLSSLFLKPKTRADKDEQINCRQSQRRRMNWGEVFKKLTVCIDCYDVCCYRLVLACAKVCIHFKVTIHEFAAAYAPCKRARSLRVLFPVNSWISSVYLTFPTALNPWSLTQNLTDMKNGVFLDVTPRGSCKNWRLGGT